jgi:hypothetical protein
MITDLKIYLIIVLALWQGVAQWQLHSVKTDYRDYKESINDQVQQAKNEKIRIESEQRAKFDKAALDYATLRQRLGDALGRLRDAQALPGHCAMPVAGNSASTMPRTPENPPGTIDPVEVTARIRQTSFYAMSMQDTLQCSALISIVKSSEVKNE